MSIPQTPVRTIGSLSLPQATGVLLYILCVHKPVGDPGDTQAQQLWLLPVPWLLISLSALCIVNLRTEMVSPREAGLFEETEKCIVGSAGCEGSQKHSQDTDYERILKAKRNL